MAEQEHPAGEEGGQVARRRPPPSYARPNVASRLPDYSNHTAEAISAAFVPNTFKTISSLRASTTGIEQPGFRAGSGEKAAFSEFAYTCSPYDMYSEIESQNRKAHEEKVREIAGDQPFVAGHNMHRARHEVEVYEYVSEPFDSAKQAEQHAKWVQEKKLISKPFVPNGVQKALQRPTRALLGDAMTLLFRSISEDWPEAQPTVLSTAEDLIVVYFVLERIRNTQGVLAYMNNALRRNDAVLKYDLRKVLEGWNVTTEDRHIMFTLRPPWVRPRAFLDQNAPAANSATPEN